MSLGGAVIGTLSACPPASRGLLRSYLCAGGYVPERARWVVEGLKQRLLPRRPVHVVGVGSGLRLEVDTSTAIGREIYFCGSYEPALATFLERILKPGMVFIDAGANLGELTVRAARRVGPEGRVLAIEASPATAEHLRRNVALNRLENVEVLQAAVCDGDGPRPFFLGSERDSGSSSLTPPRDYLGEDATVEGFRLDSLARRAGLERVDCIKLDVEGAELAALRGAEGLLSSSRPPILILEYNRAVALRSGWDLPDLTGLLRDHGYALGTIEADGAWPPDEADLEGTINIAATPGPQAGIATGAPLR